MKIAMMPTMSLIVRLSISGACGRGNNVEGRIVLGGRGRDDTRQASSESNNNLWADAGLERSNLRNVRFERLRYPVRKVLPLRQPTRMPRARSKGAKRWVTTRRRCLVVTTFAPPRLSAIALSSTRSATSFFSRRFSSSSARNRFTSATCTPSSCRAAVLRESALMGVSVREPSTRPTYEVGSCAGLTAHPRPGRISPTPVPDLSRSAILGTTANKSATSWTMRRRGGRTGQDAPGHCFQRENEQRRPFLDAAESSRIVLVWRRRELNPGPRIDRPQPLRA